MANLIENIKSINLFRNTIIPAVIMVIVALAFYFFTPFTLDGFDYLYLKPLYKTLIALVLLVIAAAVFSISIQGDRFLHFVKETRIELRKVVWPTREETIKTTGFVLLAVIIVAIFLWIVDAFFTWGVQSISMLNF